MILAENSIKPFLRKNLPWFVNQSYPLFVQFLEYYYQWLETFDEENSYGVLALLTNFQKFHDIDQTLDQLIPKFKNIYARLIPEDTIVSSRLFIKHLGDLYRTKGSEESFKLLISILTGYDANLFYPKILLIKTSHIPYEIETFIQFKSLDIIPAEKIFQLVGLPISIDNKIFIINRIIKVYNHYRFYIQFNPDDIIDNGDIYYNSIKIGECQKVLSDIQIVFSRSQINQGEIFLIPSTETGSFPAIVQVLDVTFDQIKTYQIRSGGKGYKIGELVFSEKNGSSVYATIDKVGNFGEIESLNIISSTLFNELPGINYASVSGSGASINWLSDTIGKPKGIKILDSGNVFPESIFDLELQGKMIVKCFPGFIGRIPKFLNSKNLLGNFNILPDNYYYQNFSYELRTEHSSYLDIGCIENLLHPSGFNSFYNINITSDSYEEELSISECTITQEEIQIITVINSIPLDHFIFEYESVKLEDLSPVLKYFSLNPNNPEDLNSLNMFSFSVVDTLES